MKTKKIDVGYTGLFGLILLILYSYLSNILYLIAKFQFININNWFIVFLNF